MKQIGIKLADGTFYPIMEEGKPVEKTLGLTTVNDNQTRVIVDVYRSKTGTMKDAEYVDSLQIDNLVAHPNGTADIKLNIGLDENNKLHAEMIDPETGGTSNANVTLVSRTLEERLEPTNYDVKLEDKNTAEDDAFEDLPEDEENIPEEPAEEDFELPDFEENDDEPIIENPISEETLPDENPLEEPLAEYNDDTTEAFSDEGFDLPDFEENVPSDEEISIPVAEEENSEPETQAEDENSEDKTDTAGAAAAGAGAALGLLGAASLLKKQEEEKTEKSEETAGSEPEFKEPEHTEPEDDTTIEADKIEPEPESSDATAEDSMENFELPDFEEAGSPDAATETTEAAEAEEPAEPEPMKSEPTAEDSTVTAAEPEHEAENAGNKADTKTSEPSEFVDFDLPDFDDNSNSEPENDEKSVLDDDAFFDSITADNEDKSKAEEADSTLVNNNTPSSGINFDGLYDKETAAGNSSESNYETESEEIKKKTKTPVIICIVCAIICILATLLILFVVPSKYNLLNKHDKQESEAAEIQQPEETTEIQEEPEPAVIESKEEEIVVAPEPEQVIPEPPKEPENKPADITYKIKWGDTLWDIADSYYKNPWNYKKIARYNNIKNPDYIISGTTITIPAK